VGFFVAKHFGKVTMNEETDALIKREKTLHLFLAHTPLQILSVTNLKQQYFPETENCWLLWEDEGSTRLLDPLVWKNVLKGKQTRSSTHDTKNHIKNNLQLIRELLEKMKPAKVVLYVSELLWLCNKVAYAFLHSLYKDNFNCMIFDEGLHIYANDNTFSEDVFLKSVMKFVWLTMHGLPNYLLFPKKTYSSKYIKKIYCFYPELLKDKNYDIEILPLQPKYIMSSLQRIRKSDATYGEKNAALFLSQPYSRDIPESTLREVLKDMMEDFKARGIKDIYFKPHHADKKKWVEELVGRWGFKPISLEKDVAIEVYASQLQFKYIISISSSALLYLPLFGYQGKTVSYGMSRCGLIRKYKKLHQFLMPLFRSQGVWVLD